MSVKFGSRKFIITVIMIGFNVLLPVIYNLLKIDISVTLTTQGITSTLASLYLGVNYFQHKLEGRNAQDIVG